ncbi:MAG: glycosyltransferase family 4 protein [Actinomycetia bacterium]|nr:glycosyltransferase family 4 protein [Actinomycetes bacterium]
MVTKFVPYPANAGGRIRSLAILRRLLDQGEVVLCCFDDGSSDAAELRRLGIDVRTVPWDTSVPNVVRGIAKAHSGSAGRFWDRRLAALVRRACAEQPADLLQVEYSQLAPYLDVGSARLKVLDFHNIESSLALSFARSSRELKAWLAYPESVLLRRLEKKGAERADLVLVVSEEDRQRLPGRPREVLVCPNGWDPGEVLPASTEPVAAFVALMGWKPNSDAAVWLAREVWPLVRASVPDARLLLVGREPGRVVTDLAAPDIEVTGTVPEIAPYLQQSMVALAPLLSGGGTRLKVLEALNSGRPLVSTSVGIDGLTDLIGKGVFVGDSPADFAKEIVDLFGDPERARKAGLEGAEAARTHYSWDGTLRSWSERISRLK